MYRGNGNVRGVGSGLKRDFSRSQDVRGQIRDLESDVQQRNIPKRFQPFTCRRRVACTNFVNNKLREVKLESAPPPFPPFPSDLLMDGNDQVPARPGGQVAWNGSLQIKAGLHPQILSGSAFPPSCASSTKDDVETSIDQNLIDSRVVE